MNLRMSMACGAVILLARLLRLPARGGDTRLYSGTRRNHDADPDASREAVAGRASRQLAACLVQLDELHEGMDDVATFHPTHKDSPLPIPELIGKIMTDPLQQLEKAVGAQQKRLRQGIRLADRRVQFMSPGDQFRI